MNLSLGHWFIRHKNLFFLILKCSYLDCCDACQAVKQPSLQSGSQEGSFSTSEHKRMNEWGVLEKSFVLILVTACSNGLFLTAFYWLVLYDSDEDLELDNPLRHGGNVVIMLTDVMISRFPVVSYHLQVCQSQ